ncbi:sigma-70 family RNA polymerase sigma factor [soil metagenome]
MPGSWFACQNGDVDSEVLGRFRDGDEEAVKAVYNRFSGAVYAISAAILRDPGRAADATQQTFVKAWRAASSFDPGREFAPWIYSIARRTARDIYRKERRRIPSDEVDRISEGTSMELVWEVFQVRLAVDQLTDEERQVVAMSHFEGLSHTEIAERLQIPLGTVKSRSHRAHRHLVELLGHLDGEPE